MWFIGVEVGQETSAPPPKKNPGSAPVGVREIFCQGGGGGGKPFAQKNLAGCPNFYKRVGKKGGPHYNNIGRTGI